MFCNDEARRYRASCGHGTVVAPAPLAALPQVARRQGGRYQQHCRRRVQRQYHARCIWEFVSEETPGAFDIMAWNTRHVRTTCIGGKRSLRAVFECRKNVTLARPPRINSPARAGLFPPRNSRLNSSDDYSGRVARPVRWYGRDEAERDASRPLRDAATTRQSVQLPADQTPWEDSASGQADRRLTEPGRRCQ